MPTGGKLAKLLQSKESAAIMLRMNNYVLLMTRLGDLFELQLIQLATHLAEALNGGVEGCFIDNGVINMCQFDATELDGCSPVHELPPGITPLRPIKKPAICLMRTHSLLCHLSLHMHVPSTQRGLTFNPEAAAHDVPSKIRVPPDRVSISIVHSADKETLVAEECHTSLDGTWP
mmetsp:Transcript_27406/g.46933  ORF Transcript_27406/g.46933 Transcript_27406/m.46933 type:complete len:175 (-) Transcript_27406:57-581(-)